jgi:hypothetical protein
MQMGSMDKEILMLVLPALCAVIMDPLASAVDTFWVGKLPGATSLAAMNPNTSIYNFIFMILTYALAPAVTTQVNNALGKVRASKNSTLDLSFSLKPRHAPLPITKLQKYPSSNTHLHQIPIIMNDITRLATGIVHD